MLPIKIREYLTVGLAIATAMSLGWAALTQLRNKDLANSLQTQIDSNALLAQTNENNSATISNLIAQRKLDDSIIQKVFSQYELLKKDGEAVQTKLKEIVSNDKELRDLLSLRHPDSVSGVLNARSDSSQEGDDKAKTSK